MIYLSKAFKCLIINSILSFLFILTNAFYGGAIASDESCNYDIEKLKSYMRDDDFSYAINLINRNCIDVNYEYDDNFTALSYASFSGDADSVRRLIDMGANVNQNEGHALSSALSGFDIYINENVDVEFYDRYSIVISDIINSGAKLDYIYGDASRAKLITVLLDIVCDAGHGMCNNVLNKINKRNETEIFDVSYGEISFIEIFIYKECPCAKSFVEKVGVEFRY